MLFSIKLKSPLVPGIFSPWRYLHTNQVTSHSSFLQSKQIVLFQIIHCWAFSPVLKLFSVTLFWTFYGSCTLLHVRTSDLVPQNPGLMWALACRGKKSFLTLTCPCVNIHQALLTLHALAAYVSSLAHSDHQSFFWSRCFPGGPFCLAMDELAHGFTLIRVNRSRWSQSLN